MKPWHVHAFHITGSLWGKPPVTGGSRHKGPVMRTLNNFFSVSLKKELDRQLKG